MLLVTDATGSEPPRLGPYDVGFLAAGVLFLIAVAIEFREHVPREDRREIVADVALLTAAIGTMLFLSLRPDSTADAGERRVVRGVRADHRLGRLGLRCPGARTTQRRAPRDVPRGLRDVSWVCTGSRSCG